MDDGFQLCTPSLVPGAMADVELPESLKVAMACNMQQLAIQLRRLATPVLRELKFAP